MGKNRLKTADGARPPPGRHLQESGVPGRRKIWKWLPCLQPQAARGGGLMPPGAAA